MGIYVVTGGSSGIGAQTIALLQERGHKTVNIDLNGGDITANLATNEGRQKAIYTLHERFPDGIDAMICNAGVSNQCGNIQLIISLNYFGAVVLAEGVYDLLKKNNGRCVVTSSNTISQGAARMDIVDILNNNLRDEPRVLNLVKDYDPIEQGHPMYVATKYALARWMRRVSASWAAQGLRINAIAPGNVETAMTAKMTPIERKMCMALPIPINYGKEELMQPRDIAQGIVFLASPESHGINGTILFCDGGTDALLHTDKVY